MKPECSLPHSHMPATCPDPEQAPIHTPTSEQAPVHIPTSHFLKIHLNIILPSTLGLPSGHFPSVFPTKTLYTNLLSPTRATCPARLIILNLITWTILGEEYRSLSSSLRSFLHSPVTSKYVYYHYIYTFTHVFFYTSRKTNTRTNILCSVHRASRYIRVMKNNWCTIYPQFISSINLYMLEAYL
jgi:hypothetical protein